MISVTRTYTRPSIELPWHIDQPYEAQIYTQEFKDHVQATYTATLIHQTNVLDDTKLVLNFQSLWESVADYQTYLADPVCVAAWARRDEHNTFYGITSSQSVITEL